MKATLYILCCVTIAILTSCSHEIKENNEGIKVKIETIENKSPTIEIEDQLVPCLTLNLTLQNQSDSSIFINVMTCSWMDSWILEPSVFQFYLEGCDSNVPEQIKLNSKQSITFTGQVFKIDTTIETIRLRAGFINLSEDELRRKPIQIDTIKNKTIEIYWSDWISIKY